MRKQIESIDNKKTEFYHTRKQIESIDNKKTEFYQTSSSFKSIQLYSLKHRKQIEAIKMEIKEKVQVKTR